jgi:hypothetical protein
MLDKIRKAHNLLIEGRLEGAKPSENFKDWEIVLLPYEFDTHKLNKLILLLQDVIYIEFKGFMHQARGISGPLPIKLMAWGEVEESPLIKSFFSGELNEGTSSCVYGNPEKYSFMISDFHHIFFEGFDLYINVLCRNVEVKRT